MPAKVKDVIGSVSVEQDPAKRAAALAAEALRLAEEARRANARVAEVRKSLSLKSPAQSPAVTPRANYLPEEPVLEQRDAKLTKRLSFDPPDAKIKSFNFDPPEASVTKDQEPEEERHTNPPTPPRTTPVEEKVFPIDTSDDDVVAARSDVSEVQKSPVMSSAAQKPPLAGSSPYHTPPSPPASVPAPVIEPIRKVQQEPPSPSPPSTTQAPIVKVATPTPPVSPVTDTLIGARSNSMTVPVQQQKAVPSNEDGVTKEGEEEKETNLFVRVLDAIGVDTLCGVDEEALKKDREEYAKKQARQQAKAAREEVLERQKYWATKSVSGDLSSPKIVTPPAAASATQAPTPVVRAPTPPPVIQAPAALAVEPVAAAATTTVPATAEESQPVQEAPTATKTAVTSPPVQPAAPPSAVDEVEVPQSRSAESAVSNVSNIRLKLHSDPMQTKRTQKDNLVHPVMAYPDPFGGEHEDFMPCACFNDPAIIVNENVVPYHVYEDPPQPEFEPEPEPESQQQQPQYQRQYHDDPLDDPNCLC